MQPLFALRNKISGYYLPEPAGRMGRGGSHVEPINCAMGHPNPRLFQSKLSAQRALTAWLMGKHTGNYSWESDDTWGTSYRVQDGVTIEPVPSRKKEEWEIVTFQLMLEEKTIQEQAKYYGMTVEQHGRAQSELASIQEEIEKENEI